MTILYQGLNGFLHFLLPASLRTNLKRNTIAYIRARALAIMLLTTTVTCALYLVVFGLLHWFTDPALLKFDLIFLGVLLLLVIQLWMFYRFANYWISGLAFTNFYFLVVLCLIILNGGYESSGKAVLFTCPMISFVIGSRQEGIQNALISIVVYWALIFLDSIAFKLPNILSQRDEHLIFMLDWTISVLIISITLLVFEIELHGKESGARVRQDPTRHGMSEFSKRMEEGMHGLVPAALRQTLDRRSMAYTRAQIVTVLLLAATAIGFVAAVLVIAIDLVFHPAQFQYDIYIIVVPLCFALQTWLFYKFRNPAFSGAVLNYFMFIAIAAVVYMSGGYRSPMLELMLICPIGFFMTSSMRDGVINAIVVIVTGVVLGYLNHRGIEFMDFFHDVTPSITAGIASFTTLVVIMVCMMIYDTELEKL